MKTNTMVLVRTVMAITITNDDNRDREKLY